MERTRRKIASKMKHDLETYMERLRDRAYAEILKNLDDDVSGVISKMIELNK